MLLIIDYQKKIQIITSVKYLGNYLGKIVGKVIIFITIKKYLQINNYGL